MSQYAANEINDLRKSPYNKAPADLSPYSPRLRPFRITSTLPIGTQARFLAAARAAAAQCFPLNALLTIRWSSLFSANDVHPLRPLPAPDRIDRLVENLRKWLCRHEAPPYYIWVREHADAMGEHWHIAFHLPAHHHQALADYIARQTLEPQQIRRRRDQTDGEFACGELGSWHLAADTKPERGGLHLAAYLGKGEPSQRRFRGKLIDNDRKPVRGQPFGGDRMNDRYDAAQGCIAGTANRQDRFFISNALKREARRTPARPAKKGLSRGDASPMAKP